MQSCAERVFRELGTIARRGMARPGAAACRTYRSYLSLCISIYSAIIDENAASFSSTQNTLCLICS
jgi:hypothetical protein